MLVSALVVALAGSALAAHGDGAEGTSMGPVAFLWPSDRPWDATNDNTAPCGSAAGVGNRTEFPISAGSVALSIADDAYQVGFSISFDQDPTAESQFDEQVVGNVTEIIAGHQCYPFTNLPRHVTAGTNATIQLGYYATYPGEADGKNETFYACADITFVNDADFHGRMPCFNVTAEEFGLPTPSKAANLPTSTSSSGTGTGTATGTSTATTTGTAASASATTHADSTSSSAAASSSSSHHHHLSGGAKAGIAVGSIVGGVALIGLVALVLLRRRNTGYLEKRRASKMNQVPMDKLGERSV